MIVEMLDDRVSIESLGLIPHFFERALYIEGQPIQSVADKMDTLYHYGGFVYPFEGTIDSNGRYISYNDFGEDEPLDPIARIDKLGFTLWVYPYAIVGLMDDKGNQKIARFD
jgi:hypothetical protein